MGVYKSSGDQTSNYINALFPASGSILERREVGGWTVADAGSMYFAYKLMKPGTWYHQTPNDPANKVKTTSQTHPTASLSYSYDILRSQADKNGWVLDTADASAYADLDAFASALIGTTSMDVSHLEDANPRLVYHSLSGDDLDITFDSASQAPGATHLVNGTAIDYDSFVLDRRFGAGSDRSGEFGERRGYPTSRRAEARTSMACPCWSTAAPGGDEGVRPARDQLGLVLREAVDVAEQSLPVGRRVRP
ncbi:hypothetical protein [Streptosporangium album]|uniref:hypothetical protein n=1 Tax=Streptosporangium album TaxID=47479 RepID=UPI0016226D44